MKKFITFIIILLIILNVGSVSFADNLSVDDIQLNENIQYVWDTLIDFGYSEVAAAAILGNFHRESRLLPYSQEGYTIEQAEQLIDFTVKDRDTFVYQIGGYGLAGWTSPGNLMQLWDWCEENGYKVNTYEGQLNYFNYDFQNHPNCYTRMKYYEPKDIVTATEDFRQSYERSIKNYGTQFMRSIYAKAIYLQCSENEDTFEDVRNAPYDFEIYVKINNINDELGLKREETAYMY